MENFVLYNPTSLQFGKGVLSQLGKLAKPFGKKALLVYGKGSVKQNGVYEEVTKQLKNAGIEIVEYSGIKSNPVIEDVDAAVKLGADQQVDFVIAAGGGSVIDSSKIIALCIPEKLDGWNVMKRQVIPSKALPLLAILTLAATGTEMNPVAVVQNHRTDEKIGYGHPLAFPRYSFLDPSYTCTVPANYTAYGIADLMAHCMEAFFTGGHSPLSDRITSSVILEAMEAGPLLMEDLTSYELRARIMYAATLALNGITAPGRINNGDWAVHGLGHVLSLLYDVPHGASLTIVYPAWLKLHSKRVPERIKQLGILLFNESSIEGCITRLEDFFRKIKCPLSLEEAGIAKTEHARIEEVMIRNKVSGTNNPLTIEDYPKLIQLMSR
ncbi:MAG: iron-containing alcohol dehydrogenase [Bacteroidales bacterium]